MCMYSNSVSNPTSSIFIYVYSNITQIYLIQVSIHLIQIGEGEMKTLMSLETLDFKNRTFVLERLKLTGRIIITGHS